MKRKKSLTQETIVDIHAFSHDGRGIAAINGKTTFVHGAIKGEKVLCKITRSHRRFNEAIAIQIIEGSSARVEPPCQHFGACGGCSLQHMQPTAQINLKQTILLEQLKHFGQVVPQSLLPPISGQSLGYRGKARLGVRYVEKKGKVLVGFREKFSRFLADIAECPVLHHSVGTKITALSTLIENLQGYLHIPQIEIAVGKNTTALIFRHLEPLSSSDRQQLAEFGQQTGMDIFLEPNPPAHIQKIWPEHSSEKLFYQLPVYDLTLQFHPKDFTQVNSEINPLMIEQALSLLEPHEEDVVLDLFCGLGNFTLPLGRFSKYVTGVEGSTAMVKNAEENALVNHLHHIQFYADNLMAPTPTAPWLNKHYHKILLDPPRSGAKEILAFFPQFNAQKIVYVSCNPATLARDSFELVHQQGYQLKKAGIINMFPHTSHIEAMALFEK